MAKTNYHIFVENGKVGLKDAQNRTVLFAVYDGINYIDANTPVGICKERKWGLTDVNGRTIIDPKYDSMCYPCNDRIAVCIDNKWGYIDYKGKEIIPLIYDEAYEFSDAEYCFGTPCAWVQKDGKWGTINTMGEVVIPFEYDSANDKKGKILVEKDGKRGIINLKNEFLVPLGDDEIFFHDYNIISVYNDSTYYEMNLTTMEKIETNYRVETIFMGKHAVVCNNGEKTIFKEVRKNIAKNVIDKKFNVLLPEWHEDIIMLDNEEFLLFDKNKCSLYDMASGKSTVCQYNENYAYLPDGKTMFCLNQLNETLCVKAGIENLARFSHDESDIATAAMLYHLKTVKFNEGVTTIGTGWDRLGAQSSTYTPNVDIYFPSTLNKVHPDAFSGMETIIRNVYVPYGMGNVMRSILPSHLHPFIKEKAKGIAAFVDETNILNWTEYGSNPPRPDEFITKRINIILPGILCLLSPLVLIAIVVALGAMIGLGFILAERTILPFDNITIKTVLPILVISVVSPILVFPFVRNKSNGFIDLLKGYFTAFYYLLFLLCSICGFILTIFFGANAYIGGDEPQYTNGIVTNISTTKSGYSVDVKVKEFGTEYNFGSKMPYLKGEKYKMKYHKGLFGLYFIENAE